MILKEYQFQVRKLAETKGYNQELFYLFGRMIQEASEMLDAIWQNKSDEEVTEEGADLLHFFFQILDKRPNADIDKAMDKKISKNYVTKKKTNDKGMMVRK